MHRAREQEAKKTIEVELHMARSERDQLSKTQRKCELRLKELEAQRFKLDKEHIEAVERFKSELQRSFADQDFDIHRRKLQLEQDESRVKVEQTRIASIENSNRSLTGELDKLKEELSQIQRENTSLFKDNRDMKEQLRVLNENIRRETEQLLSRDRELTTLCNENKMLRERLEELRSDTVKEEQGRLIENLRLQLNETREQIVQMKEDKQKEFKKLKERHDDQRRRENDQHGFELEKLRSEMALAQKRLGQEEHFSKELAIINNKL